MTGWGEGVSNVHHIYCTVSSSIFENFLERGSTSSLPRSLPDLTRTAPSIRASPSILGRFAPSLWASPSILRRFAPSRARRNYWQIEGEARKDPFGLPSQFAPSEIMTWLCPGLPTVPISSGQSRFSAFCPDGIFASVGTMQCLDFPKYKIKVTRFYAKQGTKLSKQGFSSENRQTDSQITN